MKRACLLCLPAVLLVLAGLTGCKDDSQPSFTRVQVAPACGVAPLQVEGYAAVSGGNETGNPTGGNNNLEIAWNFGDGHTSSTSLAYNIYQVPGSYNIIVTGTDPDGATASASIEIRVLPDSLVVSALSNFPSGVATTADTIRFDVRAESCDIDPEIPGDYVKMVYRWDMDTGYFDTFGDWVPYVYRSQSPAFRFFAAGEYDVALAVTYPAWAVTRHDTLHFTVSEAAP